MRRERRRKDERKRIRRQGIRGNCKEWIKKQHAEITKMSRYGRKKRISLRERISVRVKDDTRKKSNSRYNSNRQQTGTKANEELDKYAQEKKEKKKNDDARLKPKQVKEIEVNNLQKEMRR